MRNIFDQYSKPENRVTHALGHALAADSRLRKELLRRVTKQGNVPDTTVSVQERGEGEGIPDIVLKDGSQPICAIENKITAGGVDPNQLERHWKKVSGADPKLRTVLVITPEESEPDEIQRAKEKALSVVWFPWREVDELAKSFASTGLVKEFRNYLRVAESQLHDKGSDVMLTAFDGICFEDGRRDDDQAPSLLRHLRQYLETSEEMKRIFPGMNPELGRKRLSGYWTSLGLIAAQADSENATFNKHPHLTLGLEDARFAVSVVLPYAAHSQYRHRARKATVDQWTKTLVSVREKVSAIHKSIHHNIDKGWKPPRPYMRVMQRHWVTRSDSSIDDAVLEFSLDTIRQEGKGKDVTVVDKTVKQVETWISIIPKLVEAPKHANFEFHVGLDFSYKECHNILCTPQFPEHLVRFLEAVVPFFNLLTKD